MTTHHVAELWDTVEDDQSDPNNLTRQLKQEHRRPAVKGGHLRHVHREPQLARDSGRPGGEEPAASGEIRRHLPRVQVEADANAIRLQERDAGSAGSGGDVRGMAKAWIATRTHPAVLHSRGEVAGRHGLRHGGVC